MREYHAPFEPGEYYHIFNRGNNREDLFLEIENYTFFLEKWEFYVQEYLSLISYCLMPNHFHFLVRIKPEYSFPENINSDLEINFFLENQFKRLFSSYTLSFNKYYGRTGSLFQKRFKRIRVNSEQYLVTLIHYIHHNPIHHKFAKQYSEWAFSSFNAILSNGQTKVQRNEVLRFFGGKEQFIKIHGGMLNYKKINNLIIEH